VADGARGRRAAIRQLADLRRRLAAAEDALAEAHAASKRAEEAFDAASDRFGAAERVLDTAREDRAQARRDRYAARQAYERAAVAADRLQRRVADLSDRLDRAAELGAQRPAGGNPKGPTGRHFSNFRAPAPYSRHERTLITGQVSSLPCRDKCSNDVDGSAATGVVALPGTMRERARVGAWPDAGVVGAVLVPRRPDAAPDRAIWGHVTVRLPGAGVPVGVVVAAARRGHRFTGWRCASFPAQAPVLLLCLARRLGAPLRAF